jgi:hypothetical protein
MSLRTTPSGGIVPVVSATDNRGFNALLGLAVSTAEPDVVVGCLRPSISGVGDQYGVGESGFVRIDPPVATSAVVG